MGLLNFVSNAELVEQERAAEEQQSDLAAQANIDSSLVGHIKKQWSINKRHREAMDAEMLQCLRQREGIYDPDTMNAIREQGGSEIYMMITATKCRGAVSWLSDVLLPSDGKPWGLDPTEQPELREGMRQRLMNKLADEIRQAIRSGNSPTKEQVDERKAQAFEQLERLLDRRAELAAKKMEDVIEDQLQEGGFEDAMEEFLEDFVTYPVAYMKLAIPRYRNALAWGQHGEPIVKKRVVYEDQRVSPFDMFPSPGAVGIEDGRLIERIKMDPKDLYACIGVPGYDEDKIRLVLAESELGLSEEFSSMSDSERERIESGSSQLLNDDSRVEGLHYWGDAKGSLLQEWGIQVNDPDKYFEIEAILVGSQVIKCAINDDPLQARPYGKASWQNKPGSWYGNSIPYLVRDTEKAANGAARSLMNNMGMASGPMVMVLTDLLAEGEDQDLSMYPWKMFQGVSHPNGTQNPFQFFQPQSNANELMAVFTSFEQRADEASGVPRYVYGDQNVGGAAATASGLSALMDAAAKGLRNAIRHVDSGVIRRRVMQQFNYNMLYHEDPTIKGDINVVARGSTALLVKANAQQRRNEFLQITSNPIDMEIIGLEDRAKLLHEFGKDLDIPGGIANDPESRAKQIEEAQQQQPPEDPAIAMAREEREWKAQEAEKERQHDQVLAQMRMKERMLELATKRDISLAEIQKSLKIHDSDLAHKRDEAQAEMVLKHKFGPTGNWGIGEE